MEVESVLPVIYKHMLDISLWKQDNALTSRVDALWQKERKKNLWSEIFILVIEILK